MGKSTTIIPNVLRARDAAAYLGIAESTFWKRVSDGEFSRGIKQSPRCTVWRREELDAYLARCEKGAAVC